MGIIMAPTSYSCEAPTCEFVTAKAESGIAIQLLTSHYKDVHNQKYCQEEKIVLNCSECQYTTPDCQSLWTANWILQHHRTRANHVAPVRQVEDSEEAAAAAQKEQVKANKLARRLDYR